MKKITYSLFLSFLATFFFLSSCKKKEAEEVVKPAPTISFISGPGMTTSSITITPGSKFKVGWNTVATGGNLKTFAVDRNGNSVSEFNNNNGPKSISGSNYSETIEFTAPMQVATYTYNFKVTTDDNKMASSSITVKVATTIGGPIETYTGITLGAPTNTNVGSFFSTTVGTIYKEAEAKTSASLVNIVFYVSGTTGFLASPANTSAQNVFPSINSWTTKNLTDFKPTSTEMNATVFDGLTGDNKLIGEYDGETSVPESKTAALTVGKVVSFKTHTNKLGLIKITSISTDVNGTITFDVKVQK